MLTAMRMSSNVKQVLNSGVIRDFVAFYELMDWHRECVLRDGESYTGVYS